MVLVDVVILNPSSSVTIGNFFGTLQECVTIIWRFHLKTKIHHVHVTLNEFYEKALDIVDDIIEQYQGICGVVEEPFVNCITGDGKTEGEYLTELKAFVENNKCVLGCHSEIDSTIDEFLALIDSTNYLHSQKVLSSHLMSLSMKIILQSKKHVSMTGLVTDLVMTQMMKDMTQILVRKNKTKRENIKFSLFYTLEGSNITLTLFALQLVVTIFWSTSFELKSN